MAPSPLRRPGDRALTLDNVVISSCFASARVDAPVATLSELPIGAREDQTHRFLHILTLGVRGDGRTSAE